jgi:hypothetical protein
MHGSAKYYCGGMNVLEHTMPAKAGAGAFPGRNAAAITKNPYDFRY